MEGYKVDYVKGTIIPMRALKYDSADHIIGTPTEINDVRAAFEHRTPDVVIVTLNAPRASDSPFAAPISPPRLMADCNANVVSVMKELGTSTTKLVTLQAFGVGTSWDNMPCAFKLLMSKSNMKYQYEDHNHTDREVRESGVRFVFVRPARLTESDQRSARVWPNEGKGMGMMAGCSRLSAANFIIEAAEESNYDNQAPVICN